MRFHCCALLARRPACRPYTRRAYQASHPRNQAGFTLIELLIALVLSSLLFSSMIVVFQSQTRLNTLEQDVLETQQNARVAMNALAEDIRQAGYFVDQFNRQPIWIDAAPYQLIFNANLSERFVAMHRDSAVPLSNGTMYRPGDYSLPPQSENLPAFLTRYLNDSETIRLTLDRTYDGLLTSADRQKGAVNQNLYTLTKEINGNPPAILAYNIRGPAAYPDGTLPDPLFQYWGTFSSPDSLSLWGDANGDGRLSQAEIAALTRIPTSDLPDIRQVDVSITVETARPDRRYEGRGSVPGNPNNYRSYDLRGRIRARNVGINPLGLLLCGDPPSNPLSPQGFDTPYDQGQSITITWRSAADEYSGEDDVQFYNVYRRAEGGDFEVVGQLQAFGVDTTFTFVDDGEIDNFNAPQDYQGYYYYISAWDCAPQESNPSAVIGPIYSLPNGPGPPTILDAWDTPCDGGDDITVRFARSPQDDGSPSGVSRYDIYRGTTADTSIVSKILVDTLATTGAAQYEYHDTDYNWAGVGVDDGVPYYYIIRAVQGGVDSENSNEFGWVVASAGMSAPRLVSVDDKPADDGTALLLSWRRSPSEDCSPPPNFYRIHRRVKGTSIWAAIADIPVAFQNDYTFEDNDGGLGLINGTTYEYMIEGKGSDSAAESNIMEGTPRDNPPVGAPTGLIADDLPCDSNGYIQLTWLRSPDDGAGAFTADTYLIYRKVDGGTYAQIGTIPATGAAEYTWEDSETTNPGNAPVLGNTYWYKVTAYDQDSSSESNPTNEDDALSDGSPGAPEITAAYDTYGGGAREIRVEFMASPDDGGCSDSVTHYRIYRTTSPGQYGTYIGTVTANNSPSYAWDDNLTNSAAPPLEGFSYYYVVRAWDAVNMLESQNSNEFGPVEPYGANCDCCPLFSDDMESGNIGWTHGASPGYKDDWELGRPRGKSFDPSLAYSGSRVWGTDLGGWRRDGQYRSNVSSWLISPTLDFSGITDGYIMMSYYRWLSVEDSRSDKAQIQVNDGSGWVTIWQNSQNNDTVDTEWKLQLLDLSQWAIGKSSFRIAFVLTTNRSQQFGGWNIDDVEICYTSPSECDYFFYVGDSIAENQGNNLFFEITNGADVAVDMLGMQIGWSAEGSLLKTIQTQAGGPGIVWTTATPAAPVVDAMFSTAVPFNPDETIKFKLRFQPGQMRGSALTLRFITACGTSSEIVIMVPE